MYKIWSQKLSCDWWWEQWAYFITTQTLLFFQIGVRFARQQDPLPYLVSQPLPWQVHSVSHSRRSSKADEVSFNKICISVELRSLTLKRWHSRVTDVLVWIQLTLILHMTRPPTQPHPGHLVCTSNSLGSCHRFELLLETMMGEKRLESTVSQFKTSTASIAGRVDSYICFSNLYCDRAWGDLSQSVSMCCYSGSEDETLGFHAFAFSWKTTQTKVEFSIWLCDLCGPL